MPDGPGFTLPIETVATGTGAADTVAGLEAIKAAAASTALSLEDLQGSGGPLKPTSTIDRVAQQRELLGLIEKQTKLTADGEYQQAAALDQEIAARRLSLQIQQQTQQGEQVAYQRAQDLVALKAKAAQEEQLWAERIKELEAEKFEIILAKQREYSAMLVEQGEARLAEIEAEEAEQERISEWRAQEAEQLAGFNAQERERIALDAQVAENLEARLRALAAEAELQQTVNDAREQGLLVDEEDNEVKLRGIGTAGRAAGMLFGGDVGFAIFGLTAVLGLMNAINESAQKARDAVDKIGGNSDDQKRRLQEIADTLKNSVDAVSPYEAALKKVTAELDAQEKSMARQEQAQARQAAAEERLAEAKIDADPTLSPEAKDDAKAKAQQDAADARAAAKIKQDTEEIANTQKKIEADKQAAAQEAQHAEAAKAAAEAALKAQNELREKVKAKKEEANKLAAPPKGKGAKVGTFLEEALDEAAGDDVPGQESLHDQHEEEYAKRKQLLSELNDLAEKQKVEEKKLSDLKTKAVQAEQEAQRASERAAEEKTKGSQSIADLTSDISSTKNEADTDKKIAALEGRAKAGKAEQEEGKALAKALIEAGKAQDKQKPEQGTDVSGLTDLPASPFPLEKQANALLEKMRGEGGASQTSQLQSDLTATLKLMEQIAAIAVGSAEKKAVDANTRAIQRIQGMLQNKT